MEPASLPVTKGRGSIEDPEVLENVPGHVIPILEREFDDFDTESAKFLRGETPETEFIGFRLKQGVYGQRQPDVQMIRVKLPFGGINPEQMEAFADVIEKHVPLKKGHITTRQNVQMHHIPLKDAANAIRDTRPSGLSSREGCGNRARIKVFVDKFGIEELRAQVEEELKGDWVDERDFDPSRLVFVHDEEANAPAAPPQASSPNGDRTEFDRFVEANVIPQRQPGFSTVSVKVTRGDLTPEQFRGLAAIMRDFTGGYARTHVDQNLVLRWVRDEALYDVWQRLGALDLGYARAHPVNDVVSSPG